MRPVIGIVICGLDRGRQFVSQPYIHAAEKAGGLPVIIPYLNSRAEISRYSSLCDGFLFCGGDDISPRLYGEDLLTDQGRTDISVDQFHLTLMKYILGTSLPILCICRGMQVLNLSLGGSIFQDISLRNVPTSVHMQLSRSRSEPAHRVSFSSDSILYHICGSYLDTNSYHHQCVKTTGRDLKITGMSADGIIEAVESTGHDFCVGVQWHPECMYASSPPMRELFRLFVFRAGKSGSVSARLH